MSVSEHRDELTALSAVAIARGVREGEFSAVEVLDAHLRQIELVNPRINALVVPRFDEARRDAEAIDAARSRGQTLGPLAGVPMTVKECFELAGTPTSIGLLDRADHIDRADGLLVARLKAAGAVIVGKTNVAQLMIFHECENPVYGRTLHPDHEDRSPGGSSGGEAALIGSGAVPLGLGSDVGGSIRQPSHACGIAGLLPTKGRLPTEGCFNTLRGLDAVQFQPGPMARRVDDLTLAMRVLTANQGWREPAEVALKNLRVAMWDDDGFFTPAPAIRRAVHEAAGTLRGRGVVVEPFVPPKVSRAMEIYFGLISADGGQTFRRLLGSEAPDWRVARLVRLGYVPGWLRATLASWLRGCGRHYFAHLLGALGPMSAAKFWQLCEAQQEYVQGFFARLREGRFDAMLCPGHGLPALGHGDSAWLLPAASYCLLMNLLGVPAGVVPVTHVRPDEESDRPLTRDPVIRAARRTERGSAGLPVGVQVAARPGREDLVLALMSAIEAATPVSTFPRAG